MAADEAEMTTLEFQEFSLDETPSATASAEAAVIPTGSQDHGTGDFGHDTFEDDLDDNDEGSLLPGGDTGQASSSSSYGPAFWTLEYYRTFFDVDTEQVLSRIRNSFFPYKNTFLKQIKSRGDLYGPFWTSTTLVFVMAMASNMANYASSQGEDKELWHYDFRKVTAAATTVYTYTTLVPFVVWLILRWYVKNPPCLLDIFCIYGYSLFIFIPSSILCVLPFINNALRWLFVAVALGLSGGVLLQNFSVALRGSRPQVLTGSLGLIAGCHVALALGFKLYFFYR
eukprot:m.186246 g.186246  ORF g.186246 m.186246 type:complete len:284 (+) comp18132_c1_seq1:80-931(+)